MLKGTARGARRAAGESGGVQCWGFRRYSQNGVSVFGIVLDLFAAFLHFTDCSLIFDSIGQWFMIGFSVMGWLGFGCTLLILTSYEWHSTCLYYMHFTSWIGHREREGKVREICSG